MISASQIAQAMGCMRQWAWRYSYGGLRVGSIGRSEGQDLHDVAQAYLQDGAMPDRLTPTGQMFIAGLPYLPRPKSPDVVCEGRTELATADGIRYVGAIDFRARDWSYIGDHKTSVDPKQYALAPDTFVIDPQAVVYAWFGFARSTQRQIHLRWVYYKKFKRKTDSETGKVTYHGRTSAHSVDVTMERQQTLDRFASVLHPIGRALTVLGRGGMRVHPLALPPNFRNCTTYGGCPYRALCPDATDDAIFHAGLRADTYDATAIAKGITGD